MPHIVREGEELSIQFFIDKGMIAINFVGASPECYHTGIRIAEFRKT
jgi:hypothetical protein